MQFCGHVVTNLLSAPQFWRKESTPDLGHDRVVLQRVLLQKYWSWQQTWWDTLSGKKKMPARNPFKSMTNPTGSSAVFFIYGFIISDSLHSWYHTS